MSASLPVRLRQIVWIVLAVGAVGLDSDYVIFIAAIVAIVAVAIETRAPVRSLGLARPRSIVASSGSSCQMAAPHTMRSKRR